MLEPEGSSDILVFQLGKLNSGEGMQLSKMENDGETRIRGPGTRHPALLFKTWVDLKKSLHSRPQFSCLYNNGIILDDLEDIFISKL